MIEFVPKRATGLPVPMPAGMGAQAGFQLIGDMTLHGVTKEATWNVVATFGNDQSGRPCDDDAAVRDVDLNAVVGASMSVDEHIHFDIEFRAKRSAM